MTPSGEEPLVDVLDPHRVEDSRLRFRSGRVIDVRTDTVAMADGNAVRDVVVHPGAVGIIAVDSDGAVLLLQQYRHPVRRRLWEPPAGLLDVADEPPLMAAQRELHEEAHLEAGDWRVLVDLFTSPGMTDEAVRIFLARDVCVSQRERFVAEHEELDMPVRWVPLDEAVDAALAGRIHNPLAIAGLLAAAASREDWDALRPADSPWPEMSGFVGSRDAP